jgi:two-component system, NarL family, invasion response regulator UvrY
VKILLIDDHAVVRQGIRRIVEEDFPAATFAEASDADEALRLVTARPFDVVLVDVSLPGRSGLDILPELVRVRPALRTIVLSMHPESEFAVRAVKAGALAYVNKRAAAEELADAIRTVSRGERYITAAVARRLAESVAGGKAPRAAPHQELSDREFQVMRLLAQGSAVKEIAGTLSLSPKTVSTYRVRVLEKLKLRSTVELARYAVQHGLVE